MLGRQISFPNPLVYSVSRTVFPFRQHSVQIHDFLILPFPSTSYLWYDSISDQILSNVRSSVILGLVPVTVIFDDEKNLSLGAQKLENVGVPISFPVWLAYFIEVVTPTDNNRFTIKESSIWSLYWGPYLVFLGLNKHLFRLLCK